MNIFEFRLTELQEEIEHRENMKELFKDDPLVVAQADKELTKLKFIEDYCIAMIDKLNNSNRMIIPSRMNYDE